eukprot:5903002-Pleurochrysis_carterae.AAC.5
MPADKLELPYVRKRQGRSAVGVVSWLVQMGACARVGKSAHARAGGRTCKQTRNEANAGKQAHSSEREPRHRK